LAKQHALAALQVGGHDAQGQGHVLDRTSADLAAHIARQRLATQHAAAEDGQRPVGEGGLVHGLGHLLQLHAVLAAGIERRDQAACRGAHHQIGPDTRLLQHLDHAHVGKAARRAPARARPSRGGFFCTTGTGAGGGSGVRGGDPAQPAKTRPRATDGIQIKHRLKIRHSTKYY
jgi:hypothetical protein